MGFWWWVVGILILMLYAGSASAWGPYQARYIRNYDGDTVTMIVEPFPNLMLNETVRLAGVDTPEIRAGCEREKFLALAAKDRVRQLLIGRVVSLTVYAKDKYGRWLGKIQADGESVTDILIREGLGRAYDGGTRMGWCAGA